jgi:hypothetical protein
MKKALIPILIAAAIGAAFLFAKSRPSSQQEFSSTIMPLEFRYPEGYVVQEREDTIVIMTEEDYLSILNGEREGGEGPAAITIRVIDNPNNPGPRQWAEQYPPQSNYNLRMGDVAEIMVAGYPAVSYEADGLYPNRNIIFGTDSRLYYVNGQYTDRDSDIYRDFPKIVGSMSLR